MIKIQVKFFGAFRKFGESIDLAVSSGSAISEIKKALQNRLDGYSLVMDSVLANDRAILRDHDVLEDDSELSILPPVCGG